VPQQQGQDMGSTTSNLVVEDVVDHEVSCSFTCGLVLKRSLSLLKRLHLPAFFDNNEDDVIPCTGTWMTSLLLV